MRSHTRMNRLLQLYSVLIAVSGIGCESDDPVRPALDVSPYTPDRPFYYYQGDPVYLVAQPSRLVVYSAEANAVPTARAILGALGVSVQSVTALPQAPGHFILQLGQEDPGAMAVAITGFRRNPAFGFVLPVYRGEVVPGEAVFLNRVNVKFRDGTARVQIDSVVRAIGGSIVREPQSDSGQPTYWISYPRDTTVEPLAIAALLDRHPLVEWADPDKVSDRQLWDPPTDPYYSFQWHLNNTITRNGVYVNDNVELAWTLTTGVATTRVSVLDNGIDGSHPDICGLSGGIGFDPAFAPQPGDNVYEPFGSDNHGTQIAGVISGCQNNGVGVTGIAPGITHYPVRILRGTSFGTDAQVANGIYWAWHQAQADVLSNSWGGGLPSNAITAEINNANTLGRGGKGAIVVFAGGNTSNRDGVGPPSACGVAVCGLVYPATLASVIAVGAINRDGELTDYTPEGPELDIVSPSGQLTGTCIGEIVTTDRIGPIGCNSGPNGDQDYSSQFSGTSAAAPQVAAVAALLFSREPTLTGSAARARILNAADPWGSATQFGAGKVNADRVLWPFAPIDAEVAGPTLIMTKGTYTWEAMPSGGNGTYTYEWKMRYVDTGQELTLGTQKTQQATVFAGDGDFDLIVTVTSASRPATLTQRVIECIGGNCARPGT